MQHAASQAVASRYTILGHYFIHSGTMRYFFLYALEGSLWLPMKSGTTQASPPPETLVRAHFDLLNRHDLDGLAAQYAPDAVLRSMSWEGDHHGPAEARTAYERYFTASPDLRYRITNLVVAPGVVTVEYTSVGTMQKPEAGEPSYMDGKAYTLRNCTVFTVKNGKIIAESTYFDQVAFLRQVGFFEQHPADKK